MAYLRGFGNLTTYRFYGDEGRIETTLSPIIRTSIFEGSSLFDFQTYIRTLPEIEIRSLVDQSGTPENFEGVEASTTFAWLPANYPTEQKRICFDVYKYDDELGLVNQKYLGFTVV